jgi:hypothetical protein
MTELKTRPTGQTFASFLEEHVEPGRHADCRKVAAMMEKATGEKPVMWGSIVGFGLYRYKYPSGHSGEWPVTGFSPRKKDLTIYIMPGLDAFPSITKRLGKFKTGKSCLYLKSLADVDAGVLEELIRAGVEKMEPQRVRE